MRPVSFVAARDVRHALTELSGGTDGTGTKFIAGGTNIIDLMKENVMSPRKLVDINGLAMSRVEESADGGVVLGALARNADTAYHPLIRTHYPLLSAAILAGASAQIRNMATNGGNLLQRTRCWYFYDTVTPCNKREPGSGCSALGGLTRYHAILGASENCVATNPSDMCVALAALDATVHVESASGTREIAFKDFHRLPEDRPELDSNLTPDELITHIGLPDARRFAKHSTYLKVRDRASYAFALVSVAAMLDLADNGTVREARVALGGVAHKPWRLPEAEALLTDKPPVAENFGLLADALLSGARGLGLNDFKIPLAHRAIVRALEMARDGTLSNTGIQPDSFDQKENAS